MKFNLSLCNNYLLASIVSLLASIVLSDFLYMVLFRWSRNSTNVLYYLLHQGSGIKGLWLVKQGRLWGVCFYCRALYLLVLCCLYVEIPQPKFMADFWTGLKQTVRMHIYQYSACISIFIHLLLLYLPTIYLCLSIHSTHLSVILLSVCLSSVCLSLISPNSIHETRWKPRVFS